MDDRKSKWKNVGDIHSIPVGDLVDHDQVRTCWCQPTLFAPCPEKCFEEEDPCWRCEGERTIPVDLDFEESVQVIHNAADGRE